MPYRRILALLTVVIFLVILREALQEKNTDEPARVSSATDSPPSPSDLPWLSRDAPAPATPSPDSLYAWLDGRAQSMAASAHRPPDRSLPPTLAELDYDTYGQIRFRPEEAVWRGAAPFELQLFHRGGTQEDRTEIHLVEGDSIRRLAFEARRFRYDGDASGVAAEVGPGLGYAGFRVHYPLNRPQVKDEVVVFLGASYFRLLGPGQVHGLSSRGLALNVFESGGEEFPDFRAFWIFRPEPGDSVLTVLALLDGPSVTGAYRMEIRPGRAFEPERPATVMEVEARLHARRSVNRLGVAPLTSMFLFGPENAGRFDDFRARVHDSQALLVHDGRDEWIWRPLRNLGGPRQTLYPDTALEGFGLVQRSRDFDDYLDSEARYHRRPSEWVEPMGEWGNGAVELVELPSASEFTDNIVASWVPDDAPEAGESRVFHYRLRTFDDHLDGGESLQLLRWRSGWDALPGAVDPPPRSRRRFVVDFAPIGPDGEADDLSRPDLSLTTSTGTVSDAVVRSLADGGWRVSFRFEPAGNRPADLRLFLARNGEPVSEIWSYPWLPDTAR